MIHLYCIYVLYWLLQYRKVRTFRRSRKTLVKVAQISKFRPRLVGKSLTVGYSSDHFLIRKKSNKILHRSKFRADSNAGLRFLIRLILTKQINKRGRHHTLIHTNVIISLSVWFKSPYTMAYLLSEFYIDLNFTLIPDLNSYFSYY